MFRLMINQILKEAATGGALHKMHKKNTCVKVSFLIKLQSRGLQLYKKEPATHVFSCEFYEIFINIFFTEYFQTPASAILTNIRR